MSWKLFGQIVLLLLIAGFIMCAAKCSLKRGGMKWKHCGMKASQTMCQKSVGKLCPSCAEKLPQ